MKIKKIEIKDFRAFHNEVKPSIVLEGKNMLVYGENGSGKSSLAKAIDLFIASSTNQDKFLAHKNIFTTDIDGFVKLTLEGYDAAGTPDPENGIYEWSETSNPSGSAIIKQAAKTIGYLDYKQMLELYSSQKNGPRIDIFDLLVKNILAYQENPITKRTIIEDWNRIQSAVKLRYYKSNVQYIKKTLRDFHSGLTAILVELNKEATKILDTFNMGLTIQIIPARLWYKKNPKRVDKNVIGLIVKYQGKRILQPHAFLNEARLSAIAASILLGSQLISPPSKLKVLILDDLLIGLDLTNRLPLIRILEERFAEHQVFMFTYDQVWFEMTQIAIKNIDKWVMCDLHCGKMKNMGHEFDVPVLKPHNGQGATHFLTIAKEYLTIHHNPRVAALYTRTALEAKLKSYCNKHKIQVAYDLDGRNLNTDHYLNAIERRLVWSGDKSLSYFALQRIKLFRSGVLNPLAHYHPISLSSGEVDSAIQAVEKLEFGGNEDKLFMKINTLLQKLALDNDDIIDGASIVRTIFEKHIRKKLANHLGKINYREDWSNITTQELWDATKEVLIRINTPLSQRLISDIESVRSLLIDEFTYSSIQALTKAELVRIWNIIVDPADQLKSRIETFA